MHHPTFDSSINTRSSEVRAAGANRYAAAKDRRAHKTINNNNGRGLFSTPVEYPATQMVGVTAMALVENGEQRDGGRRSWLRTQREKQRE